MKYIIPALLLPLLASARIGEDEAQLTARYGAPVEILGSTVLYKKNGLTIGVGMFEGKCYRILYSQPEAFTRDQVGTLLAANGGPTVAWADEDGTTTRYDDGVPLHNYRSSDKRLAAFHHGDRVIVRHLAASAKVEAAAEQAKRSKEAEAVSGL